MNIIFSDQGLGIDGKQASFPTTIEQLNEFWGQPRLIKTKHKLIYVWDKLGIQAFCALNDEMETLVFVYLQGEYGNSPTSIFTGLLEFEGRDIRDYYHDRPEEHVRLFRGDDSGAIVAGELCAWFNIEDELLESISISVYDRPEDIPAPSAASLDPGFEYMKDLWETWKQEIAKTVDSNNEYYNLTHGVSTEDIARLRSNMSVALPEEMVNFYKVHNVDYDVVTAVFGFSINGWEYDLIPFARIPDEWQSIDNLQTGKELEQELMQVFDVKVKCADYANPSWIPFAEGKNGDYLLIDMDPSTEGRIGQVIELVNESWSRSVVAGSIKELLEGEIEYLKDHAEEKYKFVLGRL